MKMNQECNPSGQKEPKPLNFGNCEFYYINMKEFKLINLRKKTLTFTIFFEKEK